MSCQHLLITGRDSSFLNPYLQKTTWLCINVQNEVKAGWLLQDKKEYEQVIVDRVWGKQVEQYLEMQIEHRVMIHCQTLEIYCTLCKKELYDDDNEGEEARGQSPLKNKKYKRINPLFIRQCLLVPTETDATLYSSNTEYPPSFQKQKKGLCGLKNNSLTSYLNSVIHLLAYVPSVKTIVQSIAFQKISSNLIRQLFEAIFNIWTGKFRIYNVDHLQGYLKKEDSNFRSYAHKTPQQFLYLLLKNMLEQLFFHEVLCQPGQIVNQARPYDQWATQDFKSYNLVKDIFGGECILEQCCLNCNQKKRHISRFQSLKVSYDYGYDMHFKGSFLGLVQQALSWKNSHANIYQNLQQGKLLCEHCSQKIKEINSFVNLPNNLILQLGDDINGLNLSLPDEIELGKFIKKQNKNLAVYDYLGCISRENKRYVTHIRDNVSKKELSFSDQNITEKQRPHLNIKVAIYKRRPNQQYHHLFRNVASCLQVKVNPMVPLPDFWSLLLKDHHAIPPLMNPFICSHGKLKMNLDLSKMQQGPQRIPPQIYTYLLQIFGGRSININKQDDYCQLCDDRYRLNALQSIKTSEKEMANFADKLSNKKERVMIKRQWLERWKKFVYYDNKKGYKIMGYPRPGPINNEPIQGFQIHETHKKIAPQVWYFLQKFYSGKPRIPEKGVLPNVVLKTSVNLRLQSLKQCFLALKISCSFSSSVQHLTSNSIEQQNQEQHLDDDKGQ